MPERAQRSATEAETAAFRRALADLLAEAAERHAKMTPADRAKRGGVSAA